MTKEEKFALKRRLRERYSADEKRVYEIAVEEIDRMNTTENKGEWIDKGSLSCRCSKCGCKSTAETNFCAVCGADMRGV